MKICFIPIDNRPVCYNLAKEIAAMDGDIELFLPPREFLGDLKKNAKVNNILEWLENQPESDAIILALDTIAYGGLIPSRRSSDSIDDIISHLLRLKPLLYGKKVYAFSSIMRISNNNYSEEEKEYWAEYGKKIFEYSFSGINNGIPREILEDYLATRKRNFEINKLYLKWQKEGVFETLIFSKDDCAPRGFNVEEAKELERLGGKTKTGADEIPLTLLARAVKKDIKIFIRYTEPEYKNCISNYEDVSIEQSVTGQLELGGFQTVQNLNDADIILIVNNFIKKQGELVMEWDTEPFNKTFTAPEIPYAVADVRYANGADNAFIKQLLPQIDLNNFFGYAGWNTSANTLGSLLAGIKIKWKAKKYNEKAFCKLQKISFLDYWAYQANVRKTIPAPCDIKELMTPFEKILTKKFNQTTSIKYSFPWQRKFEVEINIT